MSNLLYFFVFSMISIAITAMWFTNKNVDLLHIVHFSAGTYFANESNSYSFKLTSKKEWNDFGPINLSIAGQSQQFVNPNQFKDELIITWRPASRGSVPSPTIELRSEFPFLIFTAWKYFKNEEKILVYPQRKGELDLPKVSMESSEKNFGRTPAGTEQTTLFKDLREFQKSDSLKRIDWRHSSKFQVWVTKQFESEVNEKILIDWDRTEQLADFEARVSQMAKWVQMCRDKVLTYKMRVREFEFDYSNSQAHYQECMSFLAMISERDILK